MKLLFTQAEKKDIPYIEEKLRKYLLDGTNIDWKQFFVARLGDKTVAFARIVDHGEFFELASLGVDYYQRKKGIGRKMLAFLIEEARRRDCRKPIYGITHLKGFIKKSGFVEVKDNYPPYFDYKRKNLFHVDSSMITVVKWVGESG